MTRQPEVQAPEMPVVQARVPAARVPARKRKADFQRKYAKAVSAIAAGEIVAEVKPVGVLVKCSTRTASAILTQAVDSDERFSRDTRGRVQFRT